MPAFNKEEGKQKIIATRQLYKETLDEMTAIHDKSSLEERDFTEEESTEYEALSKRSDAYKNQADRLEDLLERHTGIRLTGQRRSDPYNVNDDIGNGDEKEIKNIQVRAEESFKDWICHGGEQRQAEYNAVAEELRSASETFSGQNMTTNTEGGYLAPHEKMHTELITLINKKNIIRTHANIISLQGAHQLTIPAISDDGGNASWIAENDASPEGKITFSQMSIIMNRLSKTIPVSNHLINNSAFDITNIIAENLSRSMANSMELAYLDGTGTTNPLGIFNTTANGAIPITRDIKVGSSSSLIDYDGLVDAEAMLSESDRENAIWVFARTAIAELRKLKDNNGRPIFQESMLVGEPKTLLGYPIYMSDRISSNGIVDNAYIGILANLKNYMIVDNTAIELFVYNEMYQKNYAKGLQVDMFTGGAPVRVEAFVRIKAGGSTIGKSRTSMPNNSKMTALELRITSLEKELADEKLKKNQQTNTSTNSKSNNNGNS